jgi:hypothetical protein
MDTIFRQKISTEIFYGDYWGNPWAWKPNYPGGGGATVRRIAYMINICDNIINHRAEAEDSWFSERILETNGVFPPLSFRNEIIMESMPAKDPYILHQFWTYLHNYMNLPKEAFIQYWKHLLTIYIE